jgi:hypothetical protein
MSKTVRYNQRRWEVRRREPDWRMRSPSDEGRDNRTLPERGPQGPVGLATSRAPHIEADSRLGRGVSEGLGKPNRLSAYAWIPLKLSVCSGRPSAELRGDWCLKPYWGKPNVRNFREGGWKRDHGSRTEAPGESLGIATGPYRARASVLPDRATVGTECERRPSGRDRRRGGMLRPAPFLSPGSAPTR